jgi:uncharacterized protein (TIGR02271 family)
MQEQQQSSSLTRLSDSGHYEVASNDPDPRGWTVLTHDGTRIGVVQDLIVDPTALKVRYFEVALDADHGDKDRVLIRADEADLSERERQVVVADDRRTAGDWPTSRSMMSSTGEGSSSDGAEPGSADRAAAVERMTRSEEELRIGKRELEKGEVVVRKTVEQEHVRQPVERRVERVRVERRPIQDATNREARIEGGEIRVPIVEEEVVVEKRPVVKEEIVIARSAETETEVVETDIRKERVDVDGEGRVERADRGTEGGRHGRH